ncbi:MAG: NmrA family NAD(P)-binding protein [Solirubrobacteraceae bacterium]
MTTDTTLTLVLGATGKTGSRVNRKLASQGLAVRTAARFGADVRFDWDDGRTHGPALSGVRRLYLVAPVLRTDFAPQVAEFLDLAEAAGVRHVTYLSAYGMNMAPPAVAMRAVELDLIDRRRLTYSILRPAWFMQNFSETFLKPADDAIVVPTGDGAEAFIDAEDIAAVAATTLTEPDAHAGAEYAPTGPEAITVADAAAILSEVSGRKITHVDVDRDTWIDSVIASGVPADYGPVLRQLTETIATGTGSQPNDDVEKVTGVRPTHFADFARRTAAAWTTEVSQ